MVNGYPSNGQRRTMKSETDWRAEPYFYFYGFLVLLACLFASCVLALPSVARRVICCCHSLLSVGFSRLALKPMLLDIDDTAID